MNHRVTSTDLILEKALLIAKREGVDKLSIRKIATACGIAVGSVYNYYPDKEALVTAMAEVFWNNIFSDQERLYHHGMSFTQFLEWYYSYLYAKMSPYDGSWVNKHGQGEPQRIEDGMNPFSEGTKGWVLSEVPIPVTETFYIIVELGDDFYFYDSEVSSYIITLNGERECYETKRKKKMYDHILLCRCDFE